MMVARRVRRWLVPVLAAGLMACGLDTGDGNGPNGPNGDGDEDISILVLNSISGTLGRFDVEGDQLVVAGSPLDLGPNFDGIAVDVAGDLFTTSVSSFGGSQVIFGDVQTGDMNVLDFQGAGGSEVNPGKVTLSVGFGGDIFAWFAGRGNNTVYTATPSSSEATVVRSDVGRFVERVLPGDDILVALDANIDDTAEDGDPADFQPVGDSRMHLLRLRDGSLITAFDLEGVVNATEALFANNRLFVLGVGSTREEGGAFVPENDGVLAIVNTETEGVADVFPLGGNGVALEPGQNGRIFVTRVVDDFANPTQVLRFDPFTQGWERGPEDPVQPSEGGEPLSCHAAGALEDSRLVCITFSSAQQGRVYLLQSDGMAITSVGSGVGSTDLVLR